MFPLDSESHGAHFGNLTASMRGDRLHLEGAYQGGGLLPVLLFSTGVPWVEPCVKHICCLWDVAERYRDHELLSALGPTCNENTNLTALDLMKGASKGPGQWAVETMIHPGFVAMLFLCVVPAFYMYYEILPIQWVDTASAHWHASWYGKPCHNVLYPDGRQVCIACLNAKPDAAVFVFGANWFTTFQCPWVCKPGFVGPNCELSVPTALCGSLMGLVSCAAIAAMIWRTTKRTIVEKKVEAEPPPKPQQIKSDMIVFKENMLSEIRIKLL